MSNPERDWKALRRKISMGFNLKDSAVMCGIPWEEAESYAAESLQKPTALSFELKKISEAALKKAIKHLCKLVDEGPRIAESTNQFGGSTTPINSDLVAAQTLAKIAMETLKTSTQVSPEIKPKAVAVQLDLFDSLGPWQGLKKPDA